MGIFLAGVAGIFTVVGSYFAKQWAVTDKPIFFVICLFFYLVGSVAFPFALRYGTLSVMSTFAGVLAAVLTVFVGVFLFGEQLKGIEIAGIVLSVAAIALLSAR